MKSCAACPSRNETLALRSFERRKMSRTAPPRTISTMSLCVVRSERFLTIMVRCSALAYCCFSILGLGRHWSSLSGSERNELSSCPKLYCRLYNPLASFKWPASRWVFDGHPEPVEFSYPPFGDWDALTGLFCGWPKKLAPAFAVPSSVKISACDCGTELPRIRT